MGALIVQSGASAASGVSSPQRLDLSNTWQNPFQPFCINNDDCQLDYKDFNQAVSLAKDLKFENDILFINPKNNGVKTAFERLAAKSHYDCVLDEMKTGMKFHDRLCNALVSWKNQALQCFGFISGEKPYVMEWQPRNKAFSRRFVKISIAIPACDETREEL